MGDQVALVTAVRKSSPLNCDSSLWGYETIFNSSVGKHRRYP